MRAHKLLVAFGFAAACTHQAPPESSVAKTPAPAPAPAPAKAAPVKAAPDALLAWPVPRFTAAQIAEVKSCGAKERAVQVYPETVALDALPAASSLHGACDEATLAVACSKRLGSSDPPQACLDAYAQAVTANPAFAFADGLVGRYFGKLALVAPPPIALHPLIGLTLEYKWTGLGTERAWRVEIRDAATKPHVTITGATAKADVDVRDKVEAFGSALGSFLPIPQPIEAIHCTDSYPEWTATLELEGGGKLELANHRSDLIAIGGPFQMTIGGVTYLQLGPQLTLVVADLVEALGLPLGAPTATTCSHYDFEAAVLK